MSFKEHSVSCFNHKFVYHFVEEIKRSKKQILSLAVSATKIVKKDSSWKKGSKDVKVPPKKKVKSDDAHLVRTDYQVQMLLETTRDFKVGKAYEGIDWEV